jgi:hypothetical protein
MKCPKCNNDTFGLGIQQPVCALDENNYKWNYCTNCGYKWRDNEMKKSECCANGMVCVNPLCIQNHNLVYWLNRFYADNPKAKMTCKEFMDFQKVVWDNTKKELRIKVKE